MLPETVLGHSSAGPRITAGPVTPLTPSWEHRGFVKYIIEKLWFLEETRTLDGCLLIPSIGEDLVMKIYVGNLAPRTTEADLQRVFGYFGQVTYAVVVREESSGQSKGHGFVDMPVQAEAWTAIRWLDGQGLRVQGWTTILEAEQDDTDAE